MRLGVAGESDVPCAGGINGNMAVVRGRVVSGDDTYCCFDGELENMKEVDAGAGNRRVSPAVAVTGGATEINES